jgi:deaminated glutathione amidase
MKILAAVAQLTTTTDVAQSFDAAEGIVDEAAKLGAQFVILPENVSFMGPEEQKLLLAEPIDGPSFKRLGRIAQSHGIWLLGGTLPEIAEQPGLAYNTSTLFNPQGELVARYRKIHLFDVALGEGATHMESSSVAPGTEAVMASTDIGKIGMTVCYDLRFPTLFRALFHAGAEIITVPAAFTVPTGRDHWEVLLRARAIESQCYVIACGQYGANTPKRRTYGRSTIIDPWGTVLAVAPDRPGIALAEIDLQRVHDFRRKLPCAQHERPESYTVHCGAPE